MAAAVRAAAVTAVARGVAGEEMAEKDAALVGGAV